jgi:hypothetical protein
MNLDIFIKAFASLTPYIKIEEEIVTVMSNNFALLSIPERIKLITSLLKPYPEIDIKTIVFVPVTKYEYIKAIRYDI